MTPAGTDSDILRFGVFELDRRRAELRKAGLAVKLAPQPFKVLELLAGRPGELISRDDLRREVWGDETFVDFDRSLNVCITQIRSALNDSADSPRFIQTVPKRGYRFLAPIETPTAATTSVVVDEKRDLRPWILLGVFAFVIMLVAGLWKLAAVRDERTRLAILPFATIGETTANAAAIEGLTDDLITQAGMLAPAKIGVIARGSVLRFRGKQTPIKDIARELDVTYVLEGSIQAGDKVNVRLIRASDQTQVWSAAFSLSDASPKILAGLSQSLGGNAAPREAPRIRDPRALALFNDARFLLHQRAARGDLATAADRFRDSLAIEPSASAYAGLADALVARAGTGAQPGEVYPPAMEAARKAIALNEADPEAHSALAAGLFWFEWNWSEAEQHFRRALTLNPSFAQAHHDYAWLLVAGGRTLEGLRELDLALSLDPLARRVNIDAGWLLQQARRYPEAEAQARRALTLEPGLPEAEACLQRALVMQGKVPEPTPDPAKAGLFDQARQYVRLKDKENALASLERAVEAHNSIAVLLKSEQIFDWLHGEKRYQALVKRVRIP